MDRRERARRDAELLQPGDEIDLVIDVPLGEQQLVRAGGEGAVDLIEQRLVETPHHLVEPAGRVSPMDVKMRRCEQLGVSRWSSSRCAAAVEVVVRLTR